MADLNVSMILRLVDRATGPIKGVIRQVGALGKAAGQADLGRMAQRAGALRDAQRGAALEAAGMAYALSKSLQPAIAFESAMADVKKVVDFQGADGLKLLGDDLKRLSTEIPIAASELAAIAAAAGQANVVDAMLPDAEKRAALAQFTRDAARMATAFDIGAGEAGDKMAGLRNIFLLNQEQVVSLGDAVNHLSNNMASAAAPILNVLERAGSTAKVFGLTGQQTSALASTFLALKTPPEVAGTAINAMLLKLATAPQQSNRFIGALKKVGLSAEGLKSAIKDDAQGALIGFLEVIGKQEDKLGILSDLFGMEYSDDIVKLVGGLDQYRKALGLVADESGYAGSMTDEFRARAATTENALRLMSNKFNVLAVTVGATVLPALNELLETLGPVVEKAAAWAEANPELVKTIAMIVAGLVALKLSTAIVLWLFGGLFSAVLRVAQAFKWIARVVGVSMGFVASAVLVGVAAGAWLYYSWEGLRDYCREYWTDIGTIIGAAAAVVVALVDGDFTRAGDALKRLFQGIADFIDHLFLGLFSSIRSGIAAVVDALPSLPGIFSSKAPAKPGLSYQTDENGQLVTGFGGREFSASDVTIDTRAPLAPTGAGQGPRTINAPIKVIGGPGQSTADIAREVQQYLKEMTDGSGDMHDGAFYEGAG